MTSSSGPGLPPLDVPQRCGRSLHRLHWSGGELLVLDHPDAERERMLVALGADPIPCLVSLDSWNQHADDLDVLTLASRGASDVLAERGARPRGRDDVWFADDASPDGMEWTHGVITSVEPDDDLDHGLAVGGPVGRLRAWNAGAGGAEVKAGIESLLRLGNGLADRLSATVIMSWSERIDAGDERVGPAAARLRAALYGRVACTVRSWVGADVAVDVVLLSPGEVPRAVRDGDHVRIEVPFTWLRDVWIRDMAIMFGRLCLSAGQDATGAWRLLTVGPDLADVRTVTVTLD